MNYSAVAATHTPPESVEGEFDRVLQAVLGGTNRFQGLTPEEARTVAEILAEKRAEYASTKGRGPSHLSKFSGRVQTMLTADIRVKTVFEARLERRRIVPEGPIRYLGFSTTTSCRVFRFGRLPARDAADLFEIRIAHVYFAPHRLSLQEGPGFCATVLAENDHPAVYEVTDTDIEAFIAKKPVKASKR
jgi:hypothetical protein